MRPQRVFLILLALMACGTAVAESEAQGRGYWFGGAGVATAFTDCTGTTICDGRDASLQVGAGVWLPWTPAGGQLALEARRVGLGTTRLANESLATDLRLHALTFGAAWHRPLAPHLSAVVGAGVAQVTVKLTANPVGGTASSSSDRHHAGYGLLGFQRTLGGGAALGVDVLVTRAAYDRAGYDLGRGRAMVVTLGFTQRF